MKASSVRGWSSKRVAATAVVGLSAVTVLTGCGFEVRQQGAAVVNGQVIHDSDVAETVKQLNAAKLQADEVNVLAGLIAAPLLKQAVNKTGNYTDNATYAAIISAIPGATDSTKEFASAVALIQPQAMTAAQISDYRSELKHAAITLNPKYGQLTISDQAAPVYFTLGHEQPNWIVSPAAGSNQGK